MTPAEPLPDVVIPAPNWSRVLPFYNLLTKFALDGFVPSIVILGTQGNCQKSITYKSAR